MGYSITEIKRIHNKVLCVHCGEECKLHTGSYHRNEEDEYYCKCEGALKEKEIRKQQSELRDKVRQLEYDAKQLIKANEGILNKKMYEVELEQLNKKYRIR